jgi:hypothetical protein
MPIMQEIDDYIHPIEDDSAWGESWYFTFFDASANLSLIVGGRVRINQGVSEHHLCITLPDGGLARLKVEKPQNTMPDAMIEGGGIVFDRLQPMQRWRVAIDTIANITAPDGETTSPVQVAADLQFDALMPGIGTDGQKNGRKQEGVSSSTAAATGRGHFDQAGRWTGWISAGSQRWEINTLGMRDKSWGPRRWHVTPAWRIIFVNIDEKTHFGGIMMTMETGELHRGWVWEDGRRASIAHWDLSTQLADDGLTHKITDLILTDKEGRRYELRAELLTPVHFYMESGERSTEEEQADAAPRSVVISGPTRFSYDGRVGYGQMEYQHLLDGNGRALYPIR